MTILDGFRILDLTRFISGPYCSMMLGDLGADVIKIEHPTGGDGTRRWGAGAYPQDNPYYLSVNRNKRSIAIDLKKPAGREVLEALIAQSDALIQNGLFGAFDRLGFDDARLKSLNPRLIRCDITGYGECGPDRDRPAFDFTIQAESGLMSLTGDPGGPPMKVGAPLTDVMTALVMCNGIVAALLHRERTGEVRRVATSMLETVLACMPNVVSDYIVGGIDPQRWGNAHPNLSPYEIYATRDGWIALGIATEPQWARFCSLIARSDLVCDPRFATNPDRVKNRKALNCELNREISARSSDYWHGKFVELGLPSARLNTVPEALGSDQVAALGLVESTAHPLYGTIKMVRSPLSFDGNVLPIERGPPTLGQHTDEILGEVLRLDRDAIEKLRDGGIVA